MITMPLIIGFVVSAHSQSSIKPLSIGDQCPDMILDNITHYKKTKAKLSDFRGKLVIIDFWATWCVSCVKSMPKIDSLLHQYGDEIFIILVTAEDINKVNRLLSRSHALKNVKIPTIIEDRLLKQYFPHTSIPHLVWIGKDGIVTGITDSEALTAANIEDKLHNIQTVLKQKKDISTDIYKPLLSGGISEDPDSLNQALLQSSNFVRFIEGMGSIETTVPLKIGHTVKLVSINSSIDGLYRMAFTAKQEPYIRDKNPDFYMRMQARTIWEAKDSSRYNWIGRDKADWRSIPQMEKYFSYEIILPLADSANITTYALADLNRIFGGMYGIKAVKEKRRVRCLALRRTAISENLRSKGGITHLESSPDGDSLTITNGSVDLFLWSMIMFYLQKNPLPIINETGYDQPIDMVISANLSDLPAVSKALSKYGLQFIEVEREIDMVVIKDKNEYYSTPR